MLNRCINCGEVCPDFSDYCDNCAMMIEDWYDGYEDGDEDEEL